MSTERVVAQDPQEGPGQDPWGETFQRAAPASRRPDHSLNDSPATTDPPRRIPAMTSSGGLTRTGPAIRAALAELAPEELPEFEAEFRIALAEADDNFDLDPVQAVITKWWGVAHLRKHPPTEEERAAVARARAGDTTGLLTRTTDGQWAAS